MTEKTSQSDVEDVLADVDERIDRLEDAASDTDQLQDRVDMFDHADSLKTRKRELEIQVEELKRMEGEREQQVRKEIDRVLAELRKEVNRADKRLGNS